MLKIGRLASLALGAVAALGLLAATGAEAQTKKLKVALLTPAFTNDGAFNQVALEGMKKLAAEGGVEYELREKMGDPATSEPVIRQYAARGYDLIIGHGIEISLPILKVAADFPNVKFAASGGLDLRNRLLPNVDGWTYDFQQGGYLNGWIAGKVPGANVVGIVAGPQLPFILAAHRGFKAGIAETNPSAKVLETFTGSFDDVQKAAEAARGHIAQGATVLWTSGDGIGNGVTAAAAAAGGKVVTLGATGEAGGLATKVLIAKLELDMHPVFKTYVTEINGGQFGGKFHISGLANRGLVLTPINQSLPNLPKTLQADVNQLIDDLAAGKKQLPDFTKF
jgi:basic membrane lipoprotein Med (substrate-binding protein (PBP1-ABC) superfamily)